MLEAVPWIANLNETVVPLVWITTGTICEKTCFKQFYSISLFFKWILIYNTLSFFWQIIHYISHGYPYPVGKNSQYNSDNNDINSLFCLSRIYSVSHKTCIRFGFSVFVTVIVLSQIFVIHFPIWCRASYGEINYKNLWKCCRCQWNNPEPWSVWELSLKHLSKFDWVSLVMVTGVIRPPIETKGFIAS